VHPKSNVKREFFYLKKYHMIQSKIDVVLRGRGVFTREGGEGDRLPMSLSIQRGVHENGTQNTSNVLSAGKQEIKYMYMYIKIKKGEQKAQRNMSMCVYVHTRDIFIY
jgi:hypothetical protein